MPNRYRYVYFYPKRGAGCCWEGKAKTGRLGWFGSEQEAADAVALHLVSTGAAPDVATALRLMDREQTAGRQPFGGRWGAAPILSAAAAARSVGPAPKRSGGSATGEGVGVEPALQLSGGSDGAARKLSGRYAPGSRRGVGGRKAGPMRRTVKLNLPPEAAAALADLAERDGVTMAATVARLVETETARRGIDADT